MANKQPMGVTMRVIHRYLGFFLVGIMAMYALSGTVLIFRDTDFFKQERHITKQVKPNATAEELQDGYEYAEWASEQACSSFIRELNELIKFACAADYCELSEVFRAYIQTSEVDEPAEKLFSLINEYGNPFKRGE